MLKLARQNSRRGLRPPRALVWAAGLGVAVTLLVVVALHLCYSQLVRTRLQVAADIAAMAGAAAMNDDDRRAEAAARETAGSRFNHGGPITPADTQVEFGVWDQNSRTFHATPVVSNALRVAVRGAATDFFLGRVFGRTTFPSQASAIAAAEPRDIALVVDLSAAANDQSQPPWTEHAARRAILAALTLLKERNHRLPDPSHRDWVSVITFGSFISGTPMLVQPLTSDYDRAATACLSLATTHRTPGRNIDAGLLHARKHLLPAARKGAGRDRTDKVVVLISTGAPTAYVTRPSEIDAHRSDEPSRDYYANGAYWLDAPLVQAAKMRADRWKLYAVGIGPSADYDFLDRLARLGGAADADGHAPRTSATPVECEERLVEILRQIVRSPQVSLVQ